jgi:signal transduction histidine kinase
MEADPQGSSTMPQPPSGPPGRPAPGDSPAPRPLATLAVTVAVALAYFAAGKLGLKLAFVHPSATAVWPPTGIALAACLLYGRRVWPGIFLGAFLVNLTTAGTLATSLGIALGNTLEGVLGAYLVTRYANGARAFERPQDVVKFVGLAALSSTAVSPTLGIISLSLGGVAPWSAFGAIWFTWWLGDASGALLVAPLIVQWARDGRPAWDRGRALEALGLFGALLVTGLVVFAQVLSPERKNYPLAFLSVPIPVWAAFRFGQRGAVTAVAILSTMATWCTLRDVGPFAVHSPNESLLLLQAFMAVTSTTTMLLAAVVSERRRAHDALAFRTADLARSNTDLERFAYVASHDLQEPLRMVTSFLQLLEQRYRGRLDADADEFIRYAVEGAKRMTGMIADLLAFSRAGRKGEAAPSESADLLSRAVANLGVAVQESAAQVTHGPLPRVLLEPSQLIQLFQNLLANSIKFRGEARPEIHVAAERRDGEWLFSVRDNGIGLEPASARRIFEMFQRLHPRDRYPGTGMGLAICRRIVESHGGRIWVESRPGEGATFYFALPVAPAAEGS